MWTPGDRALRQDEPVLRVWAAASLGPVLEELAGAWGRQGHPRPVVTSDATSRMAAQVAQGAPADLLLTADARWMEWAVERQAVSGESVTQLATNRLVLATGASSTAAFPEEFTLDELTVAELTLAELLRRRAPGARIGVAGESVPAGRFARQTLGALGVSDELEPDLVVGASVKTVVEWVARGEVELGFVYASDAVDPRIQVVREVAPGLHEPARVMGGVVVTSAAPDAAAAFLTFLRSPPARAVLQEAGFGGPRAGDPAPGPEGAYDEPAQDRIGAQGTGPSLGAAISLSIRVALMATLLSALPAIALGWLLARKSFPGKSLVSAILLTPLVIPPVVTGFLLLSALGAGTPVGRALAALGVSVPFTFLAAVLAAAVVGFPLFVISVRNAFETVDPRYEEMSWTLGSRPLRTFWRVSLPLAAPGIGAGAVLSFARALGEFGATVVLAGNLEGETRTIALAVYTLLEAPAGREAIWVLVGASVGISLLALAGFEVLSRRQQARIRRRAGV